MLSVTIVSVCVPRKIMDYTVTFLDPTSSTNISYCTFILLKSLPPGVLEKYSEDHSCDNHLAPTFYKLSLGRCPHQDSLSVAKTWAISIGITCFIDMYRSVCTTSNRNQVAFFRCIHFCKQSFFVDGHARGADFACTSRKRFL